jgi:hypothetical protein
MSASRVSLKRVAPGNVSAKTCRMGCAPLRPRRRGDQFGHDLAGGLIIMKRYFFTAALLAGFCVPPVLAQETKVGDWTIEKRSQDTHCNASRSY